MVNTSLQSTRRPSSTRAFTIVEVMMASVILVVGFMGMIQAVTIGSEMLATARRQTLAAQILNHEIEKLRLLPWDVSAAAPNEQSINDLPTGNPIPTSVAIDDTFADAIKASGVTFTLTRTTSDLISGELKEVTLTISWTKGNLAQNTAATTPTGSWLQRLAFYRETPIARTYTRRTTTWFTKYGLNHAAQRS